MKLTIDEFGHLKKYNGMELDHNTYQALPEDVKAEIKANFHYEDGGAWTLKPNATITPEIDEDSRELAEMRISRGLRRGKTKEEIIAGGIHPYVFELIAE